MKLILIKIFWLMAFVTAALTGLNEAFNLSINVDIKSVLITSVLLEIFLSYFEFVISHHMRNKK